MPSRRFVWVSAIFIALTLAAVTGFVLSRDKADSALPRGSESTQSSQTPSPSVNLSTAQSLRPGKTIGPRPCVPNRLIIPSIGVDAVVLHLPGVDGSPVSPDNPTEASWMSNGVIPGNPGAAPIQGHTWSGGNGVLDNLGDIRPGDVITLIGKGCQLTFVVKHVKPHANPNLSGPPLDSLYPVTGTASLTVVTCGDFAGGAYHSRIVVRAYLEAVQK